MKAKQEGQVLFVDLEHGAMGVPPVLLLDEEESGVLVMSDGRPDWIKNPETGEHCKVLHVTEMVNAKCNRCSFQMDVVRVIFSRMGKGQEDKVRASYWCSMCKLYVHVAVNRKE